MSHVAVIDIGKTNVKLVLVRRADLSEIAVITRPNLVCSGPPYPHFDVQGHWEMLLDGLTTFHATHGVDAISVTTHGACVALLDREGALATPILDYEHAGPDALAEAYDAVRPSFEETGSPRLAGGLNIGAQLFWQFQTDPTLLERTCHIVTYPQFWGAKLTGVVASDVTSLGCHTDLWSPHAGCFSSIVDTLGIAEKMAPVRRPSDRLGPISADVAARTGLDAGTEVYCGLHDSNASLLPYINARKGAFSVISTGTWVVAFSVRGRATSLDPSRDTLINVNAQGVPTYSARFMGGREFELMTTGDPARPSQQEIGAVLASGVMLLPAVVADTGPFQGREARWVGEKFGPDTTENAVAVSLYLALVTSVCLENIGHQGDIFVEGPFGHNDAYLQMLSAATGSQVFAAQGNTGTSAGAALLVEFPETSGPLDLRRITVPSADATALQHYRDSWRRQVFGVRADV